MTNRKNRRGPSLSKGRDKANAQKLAQAIKSLIKELDLAGRKYKKSMGGHRAQVYASMQTAQRVIVECSKDKAVYSGFVRAFQRKAKNAHSGSVRFNLSHEAMARSMGGATDIKTRKLASKRAKVLDYLRKVGVKADDTAATVKEKGLENLGAKARKDSGKPKKTTETKSRQPDSKVKPTISSVAGRDIPRAGHNDTEAFMVFYMKQSDRDQLRQSKLGTVHTVLVSRVDEDDGDIQVQLIAPGNHLSDWED
jgi:hypothetical protein